MATVKITELPAITVVNANTANTILVGVDIESDVTGKITLTTLANGLYSNNNLRVGNNDIVLANAVGQFTGNSADYLQVTLRNNDGDGSGDFVVTADDGSDSDHYIDFGINGSTYSDPEYSATDFHDGYLYLNSSGTSKGNLVIGTTNGEGKINFTVGGMELANVVGTITTSGIFSKGIDSVVTANAVSANSVVNTRISANVATLRGEITANATSANSVINTRISANVATLNGSITSNIATQNTFTQAAFDKANNALANTTGIFDGSLTILNNLTTNGVVKISNSSFSATQAAFAISASNTGVTQTPSADGYMIHITGKHNVPTRVISDSFGANGQLVFPSYVGRAARGNVTNPSAAQTNDVLVRLAGSSYGTTGYQVGGTARIDIVATENHTDSTRGTSIKFFNVPNGTNTITNIATFNATDVTFTGVISPEKGFIYTPRILAGAQTAITIDFSTDSMVRATFNSTLTISFANYVYGKVVECWLTNTSGSPQSVTHGCLANNATTGSTSQTVAAGRSLKLQYFSIDGDLPNTFVAITYA